MLLKITNSCEMGCTHCLQNSVPNGEHMDRETFYKALEFIKKIRPKVLLVSGGEPLDNPNFFEYMNEILKVLNPKTIVLATNGMFLSDSNITKRVLDLGVNVQVTNDKRYYPKRIPMYKKHKNLLYGTHIETLYPQGRAVENGFEKINVTAPKCFNLRSIAINSSSSLNQAISLLEGAGKFCTPLIGEDGSLYAGESTLCNKFGNVSMSEQELFNNLKEFRCNKCKMFDNLNIIHKMVVGEV